MEEQDDSILADSLFIEIESGGERQTLRLLDDGAPPDVRADDNRYSGMVSVDGAGFSSALMDGAGGIIWANESLSIPREFELPSLRIVVTGSGVDGSIVNDAHMEPGADDGDQIQSGAQRRARGNLSIISAVFGFAVGALISIGFTRRRRDPLTAEKRLELITVGPTADRGAVIGDLVTRTSEGGPLLLVTVDAGIMGALSEAVGVVMLPDERPSVKDIAQFVSDSLMVRGRAITVIDGAKALAPLGRGEAERSLLHEIERCVAGVVYFVS